MLSTWSNTPLIHSYSITWNTFIHSQAFLCGLMKQLSNMELLSWQLHVMLSIIYVKLCGNLLVKNIHLIWRKILCTLFYTWANDGEIYIKLPLWPNRKGQRRPRVSIGADDMSAPCRRLSVRLNSFLWWAIITVTAPAHHLCIYAVCIVAVLGLIWNDNKY